MNVDWEAFELARYICDYDHTKAQKLIDLIKLMTHKGCEIPNVKMVFPEEQCFWLRNGKCWVDMPDSIHQCKGHCDNFKEKSNE